MSSSHRWINPARWEDPYFTQRSLKAKYLYLFLYDRSNNAGFIAINYALWSVYTGIAKNDISSLMDELEEVVIVENGYAWLKNHLFLNRNYPLNPENNAHKSIFRMFEERSDHSKAWKFYNSHIPQDISSQDKTRQETLQEQDTTGPLIRESELVTDKHDNFVAFCSDCENELSFSESQDLLFPSYCCSARLIRTASEIQAFMNDLQEVDSKQVQS